MDMRGSSRPEEKWTDKGDIFEIQLARLDAFLGSMCVRDVGGVRDKEESRMSPRNFV